MEKGITYKRVGVNIDAANRFIGLIKPLAESTYNKSVIGGIGGFAGLYSIPQSEIHGVVISQSNHI
jgi:phosphoribosylformylglycinamidine cyclo-ligase